MKVRSSAAVNILMGALLSGPAMLAVAHQAGAQSAVAWKSVEHCYQAHIDFPAGAFSSLNGDSSQDLLAYCEWAYREELPDFSIAEARIRWQRAAAAPMSRRKARIEDYFKPLAMR